MARDIKLKISGKDEGDYQSTQMQNVHATIKTAISIGTATKAKYIKMKILGNIKREVGLNQNTQFAKSLSKGCINSMLGTD